MAISIQDMKSVIKVVYHLQADKKLHVPVCFWSRTGVGKTASITQSAAELSQELGQPVSHVVLKPAQADSAGDLLGLPITVQYHECPWCGDDQEAGHFLAHAQGVHQKSADEAQEALADPNNPVHTR